MYFAMFSNIKPEKLNLELFSISEKTIYSPITIEDKESTDKKREEAIDQVEDVYTLKKEYAQNRVDLLSSIFDSVSEVNKELDEEFNLKEEEANSESVTYEPTLSQKLERFKTKIPDELSKQLSVSVFSALLQAPPEELSITKDASITAVNNVMSNPIDASEVDKAIVKVENELSSISVSSNLQNSVVDLARFAIVQNYFYDPEATEEKKQQAIDAVEPVKILQGQIIVEEGQLIRRDIYNKLQLVGLLDNDSSLQPFIGLGLIIMLMIAPLIYYFHTNFRNKNTYLLIYSIIFSITIVLMKTVSLFQKIDYSEIGYLVPIAMGTLLVKILLNERIAIVSSMIYAVCGSIIFNEGITSSFNFSIGIYFLFSGLAGVLLLNRHHRRTKILQAGLVISIVNTVLVTAIMMLKNGQYSSLEISSYLFMSVGSGVISAILTIGLLPFFEVGFGILSTMKLFDLSNPNHPLLRKILTETPGTYHHSVMVANLAESACESIGADGLLARVGSYYHDIGKTNHPSFFIENQMNIENPHDKLAPQISKNIIIAHAIDGAELLKKFKMPKEIINIAEQHHGTSLLKFFYHKAQQLTDKEIQESDYRYPGPKPQSKEAAIIGIADSVEAAVRSLTNPTLTQIELLVKSIISEKLQDEQFNECDITLKELNIVAQSLRETLHGIFHSRIEYPEVTRQKVKEA